MIDKIEWYFPEAMPVLSSIGSSPHVQSLSSQESYSQQINLSGRQRGHFRIIRGIGESVIFQCQKDLSLIPDGYLVRKIIINPTRMSSLVELINIFIALDLMDIFEFAVINRIDYAVDIPRSTSDVVRGAHFERRSVREGYNFSTNRSVRQVIMGSQASGDILAIYDRGRMLRDSRFRNHDAALAENLPPELTRLERRLTKRNKIPTDLKNATSMRNLVNHFYRVLYGVYNPFESIHYYDISFNEPEQPDFNRTDWNDEDFKREVMSYVDAIPIFSRLKSDLINSGYSGMLARSRGVGVLELFLRNQVNLNEPFDLSEELKREVRSYCPSGGRVRTFNGAITFVLPLEWNEYFPR